MKKGETGFDNMTMPSFGNTIVLWSMWWCDEMRDASGREKVFEFDKFPSTISK